MAPTAATATHRKGHHIKMYLKKKKNVFLKKLSTHFINGEMSIVMDLLLMAFYFVCDYVRVHPFLIARFFLLLFIQGPFRIRFPFD